MNEEKCNCVKCGWCCTDMEVKILDLVNPKAMMNEAGFEFWKAHGLQDVWEKNGMIKIVHRCQHLDENNLCSIEQDKPDLCGEWVCRRHLQDQRWFSEQEGNMSREILHKIMWTYFSKEDDKDRDNAIKMLLMQYMDDLKRLKEVQMPQYGANHGPQIEPRPIPKLKVLEPEIMED